MPCIFTGAWLYSYAFADPWRQLEQRCERGIGGSEFE
jgi:hypothetical protein